MSTFVSNISIYPVKSCGGVSVKSAELTSGGLSGDRRYMLVDESGRFLSARVEPSLLQVETELCTEVIRLMSPRAGDFRIPREPSEDQLQPATESTVWRDTVGTREHKEGSEWFSAHLSKHVRLVYQPQESLRPVNPRRAQAGDRLSLADGYPLLLTNDSSLTVLNERLVSPVSMSRFRPNLVISGGSAFEEDQWCRLSINGISARAPKLCERCVMITVDAHSGRPGKEPLKTLATFRRWKGAVWFGSNLIFDSLGKLSVGDEVRVLERYARHPSVSD